MSKTIITATAMMLLAVAVSAQTVTNLTNSAPDGAIQDFQLTDGTILVQGYNYTDWWKLTPDITGSYLHGTWSQVASLPSGYAPYAFASAVMIDGRVVIAGGEYNFGNFVLTNLCAVYDPIANTWTEIKPPKGWGWIGDSPSVVLPNGKYLIGDKLNTKMAELDPITLKWKKVGSKGKADFNAEEGWTLMPAGTVLTADVKNSPNSERYLPSKGKWVSDGSTVADLRSVYNGSPLEYGNGLFYYPPGEIGPAILRPDGTVFATGATPPGMNHGHTAIYKPGVNFQDPGTWTAGPDFPAGDDAGDSFACLLPNGNVLVEGESGYSYVYNGTTFPQGPYIGGCLMVLPTGEVLVGGYALYSTTGTYSSAWQPVITNAPSSVTRGSSYQLSGQQFNGLSQANAFGDELQTATNYPLVRITNNSTGHVFYARTHNHSTMGVATGSATVSTNFDVAAGTETGPSTLVVVANGIPSAPINVTVN